jgi:hypothetical protein
VMSAARRHKRSHRILALLVSLLIAVTVGAAMFYLTHHGMNAFFGGD